MQTIRLDEEPTQPTWQLIPLYKTSATGGVMMWQVGFNGHQLEMTHGYVGGAIRTDYTDVVTNQSGKSLQEQALLEARSRYRNKYTKDLYRPAGIQVVDITQPGLADKRKPGLIKRGPGMVQPQS